MGECQTVAFDFRQRAPGKSLSTAFQPLHCKQPLHTRDSGTRLTSHLKLRRIQAVQAISCILEPELEAATKYHNNALRHDSTTMRTHLVSHSGFISGKRELCTRSSFCASATFINVSLKRVSMTTDAVASTLAHTPDCLFPFV